MSRPASTVQRPPVRISPGMKRDIGLVVGTLAVAATCGPAVALNFLREHASESTQDAQAAPQAARRVHVTSAPGSGRCEPIEAELVEEDA